MRPTQGIHLIEKELRIGGLEKLPFDGTFHPRQTSQNLVTLRQYRGLLLVDRKRIETKAGSGLAERTLLLVDLLDSRPLLRQIRITDPRLFYPVEHGFDDAPKLILHLPTGK